MRAHLYVSVRWGWGGIQPLHNLFSICMSMIALYDFLYHLIQT